MDDHLKISTNFNSLYLQSLKNKSAQFTSLFIHVLSNIISAYFILDSNTVYCQLKVNRLM